jgi:hypothetical protein
MKNAVSLFSRGKLAKENPLNECENGKEIFIEGKLFCWLSNNIGMNLVKLT